MALSRYETPAQRIRECLDMVELSQKLITVLEELITRDPGILQEAGDIIGREKETINMYQQEIETCTT